MKYFQLLFLILLSAILISCGESNKYKIEKQNAISKEELTLLTQEEKEDYKAAKFNIKERSTTSYFYNKYGKVSERGFLVEKRIFDEYGYLEEVIRYLSNGDIDLRWIYEYDENHRLVKKETFTGMQAKKYAIEMEYDEKGNEIIRREYNFKTKDYNTIESIFNDLGNKTAEKTYNPKGELMYFKSFEYDEFGNVLKEVFENNQGSKFSVVTSEYDSTGRISRKVTQNFKSAPVIVEFKYDSSGYLIQRDMGYLNETFQNDDSGNILVEKLFHRGDALQQKLSYTYDRNGLLIERIRYDGMENPALFTKYEYEFY